MLDDLPATESMVPRPIWERVLRRQAGFQLGHPTDEEVRDAILLLADETLEDAEPELYEEAFRVFERASR